MLYIGDLFGRRRMMWLAMAFIIRGATLQTSAYTIAHLVVERVICGIGTGIDSSTVPMYQSELCEKERRGRLISWEVLLKYAGVIIALSFSDHVDELTFADKGSIGSTLAYLISVALFHGGHRLRCNLCLHLSLSYWCEGCRNLLAG